MAAADYNLRHLTTFAVVAEQFATGSRQALALFSQGPIQTQLAQLEDQMGVALFDRGGQPKLTAAGQALLPHVRAALVSIDEGIGQARGA
jgi:DNA-binding transcriptional LysR family regulator